MRVRIKTNVITETYGKIITLRKHAYSNILKILQTKPENFQIRINHIVFFIIFSGQNIDCGYSFEPLWQGGSNKYPQSMSFSKIRKLM